MPDFINTFREYFVGLMIGLGGFGTGGMYLNLAITIVALPICFLLGFFVGLARISGFRLISFPVYLYIELIKATPLLLGIFWFYYFIPLAFDINSSLFASALISFVFFGTAQVAEAVRSGFNTIRRPLIDSAKINGLTRFQILYHIVIPKIFYTMIPALMSLSVSLFKDTATVFVIGMVELTQSGMTIANRYPEKLIPIYFIIGIGYLSVCLFISGTGSFLQSRFNNRISAE
jgi:His/Glu/Gln/Arg/opine family amino acid ABC transporter permease subunit